MDFKSQAVTILGFPYFEPYGTKKTRKLKQYTKARLVAYNGSVMHFMRSLYLDSTIAEGFTINDFKKIRNVEKDRVKAIVNEYLKRQMKISRTINIGFAGVPDSIATYDTVKYYRTVIQQSDYFDILGTALTAKDFVTTNAAMPSEKDVRFQNDILVRYTKEAIDPNYYGFLSNRRREQYQTTRILYTDEIERVLRLSQNGSFYHPLAVFLDGYMGFEKMADMLPIDYEPGE